MSAIIQGADSTAGRRVFLRVPLAGWFRVSADVTQHSSRVMGRAASWGRPQDEPEAGLDT